MDYSRYSLYVQAMADRNALMLVAALGVYFVVITGVIVIKLRPAWARAFYKGAVIVWHLSLVAMAYYYFAVFTRH